MIVPLDEAVHEALIKERIPILTREYGNKYEAVKREGSI